jgi:hypothetical protein
VFCRLDISGVIRDCLCMFELNKIHVYFPNGSDFHIQLPFKVIDDIIDRIYY